MGKVKSASMLVGIAAALAFAANAPAFAADYAYNHHPAQFLTATPTTSDPESCVVRDITLAADTYVWKVTFGDETDGNFREIKLAAGRYKWDDCLQPEKNQYYQVSILTPLSFNGDSATLSDIRTLGVDATISWGSQLAME